MAHEHQLFQTPDQVRKLEQAQRTQGMTPSKAAIFNAAFAGGDALQRGVSGLFGGNRVDTNSTEVRRALQLQEQLKGIDFQDRASVIKAGNTMIEAGHFNEGQQILAMAPGAKHTQGRTTVGDDTLLFNTAPDGEVTKIHADSPTAATTKVDPLAKLNPTYNQDLALDEDGRKTLLNSLQNNKKLTGMFTKTTKEEVEDHAGLILNLGQEYNKLEANESVRQFWQDKANPKITDQQARQLFEFRRATTPRETVRLMAKLYRESGLERANSTDSLMGSEEAAILKSATIPELMKRAALNNRKLEILAKKEQAEGGIIRADPNGKGFRMDTIPTVDKNGEGAQEVFSNIRQMDNEQIRDYFINKFQANFDNKESLEWHEANWNRMRATQQNQEFTAQWFEGTVRQRSKLAFDLSKDMWESEDLDGWADIQLIHKYLSQLVGLRTKEEDAAAAVLLDLGTDFGQQLPR